MNERELKKLLAPGETETVEFKETPNERFYKTLSALANTKGGMILLGVNKKGNIAGVDPSSRFLEDMTNRMVNKLSIYPEIEAIDIKGKRVIAIGVARSPYPVSYEGRYYERLGNTTRDREIASVSKPTATRELAALAKLSLLEQQGITGKGTFYTLRKGSQRAQTARKELTKGS